MAKKKSQLNSEAVKNRQPKIPVGGAKDQFGKTGADYQNQGLKEISSRPSETNAQKFKKEVNPSTSLVGKTPEEIRQIKEINARLGQQFQKNMEANPKSVAQLAAEANVMQANLQLSDVTGQQGQVGQTTPQGTPAQPQGTPAQPQGTPAQPTGQQSTADKFLTTPLKTFETLVQAPFRSLGAINNKDEFKALMEDVNSKSLATQIGNIITNTATAAGLVSGVGALTATSKIGMLTKIGKLINTKNIFGVGASIGAVKLFLSTNNNLLTKSLSEINNLPSDVEKGVTNYADAVISFDEAWGVIAKAERNVKIINGNSVLNFVSGGSDTAQNFVYANKHKAEMRAAIDTAYMNKINNAQAQQQTQQNDAVNKLGT